MSQINKPSDYFNTVTWSGDNTSPRTITGVGFQPDWVWLKNRTGGTRDHYLSDVVRGADKSLNSNLTDAEVTAESNGYTSAFTSDGFTLLNGGNSVGEVNDTTRTYVAWNWLSGGTASSNTDGSITSQVSANTTSGFSIVRWSGTASNATIGHGLGVAPKMIICKDTSDTYNWGVYHQAIGNTKYLYLNSTAAEATSSSTWNNTTPTSTVFSVGNAGATNASGTNNMIAYCFAEKKGYSKFGSYTGNGSTDGTFVYTGFKPAWVMVKRTNTSGGSWVITDNKRSAFNEVDKALLADSNIADYTGYDRDFLSNGFKLRTSEASHNQSGGSFIYMAFAAEPLTGTNGIPCTAR